MAKPSEVLRHAFRHYYDPESLGFYPRARYMCYAVGCCDRFTRESRRAAQEAIHQAMREHAEARGGELAKRYLWEKASGASLAGVLANCHERYDATALRAWHLALIERLEAVGN